MANDLTTITTPVAAWTTKAGAVKQAFTHTSAASAPAAVRLAAARATDLTHWSNGQFGPLLRDVRAALSAKQVLKLAGSVNLAARNKVDAISFFTAVLAEFPAPGMDKAPKGAKGALLDTVRAVLDYEVTKAANLATPVAGETLPAPVAELAAALPESVLPE